MINPLPRIIGITQEYKPPHIVSVMLKTEMVNKWRLFVFVFETGSYISGDLEPNV